MFSQSLRNHASLFIISSVRAFYLFSERFPSLDDDILSYNQDVEEEAAMDLYLKLADAKAYGRLKVDTSTYLAGRPGLNTIHGHIKSVQRFPLPGRTRVPVCQLLSCLYVGAYM